MTTPERSRFQPVDASVSARFVGPATFARLPLVQDLSAGAEALVVGVPFDGGTTFRPGARFAPQAIREASRLLRPYNPALDVSVFERLAVADYGDLDVNPNSIEHTYEMLSTSLGPIAASRAFLVVLGGDHSISLPVLRSLSAVHGMLSLVHLDAHLDTWDTYFGRKYTHGTPFRRAAEEGCIAPDRSIQVGIRGPLYAQADVADNAALGFSVLPATAVDELGARGVAERILGRVRPPVYVSIDVDVADPAFAPGTGTPEAGGLTSRELLAIIRALRPLGGIVGCDVMEVSPPYDHAGITATLAATLAYELLCLAALGSWSGVAGRAG